MTDPPSDPPAVRPKSRARQSGSSSVPQQGTGAEQLSYRQAQAALERSLVELQSNELDVERMTELYQQACAYADRCDSLLQAVEADVMLWDPDDPEAPPQPLIP
jgi:exodeoxyribonuclease VII small subunit